MRQIFAGAVALALAAGAAAGARAQAVVSTGQSFVTARLLPGAPAAGGGRLAGLSLTLADGWKTYWRSPGEAGVPPVFDWSGSRNLRSAEILWPRPELFESFGMRTVGYSHRVVLPVRLLPKDPGKPIEVRLKADLGVCEELCVLEQIDLARTIAPGAPAEGAAAIARALAAVPAGAKESGLSAAWCRVRGAGSDRKLEARLEFSHPLGRPVVLVEGPESVWISDVESRAQGGELDVSATVSMIDEAAWIDRRDLRLTVLDDAFAADVRGCAAPPG